MAWHEIILRSQSHLPFNPPKQYPFTLMKWRWTSCLRTSFLLKFHSINDRSFNLYLVGEVINLSSDFPLPPTEKTICSSKVCLEMKPNSMFPLQMVDLFQLVAALLI